MPAPITRGSPRDWRTAPQTRTHSQDLRSRQILNEQKTCECPGCSKGRAGVSRYCSSHRDAASSRGDPLARLPSRNELAIFRKAIDLYLAADPRLAERVSGDLKALERTKAVPPSFCLGPADIHPKLPQMAKAIGLRANWQHKEGRSYTEAVVHALALMGWVAVYYDTGHAKGIWRNREAFLRTRAGALLGDFRKTVAGRQIVKSVSGAVHRHLGADFLRHARAIFGPGFWDSPVATHGGQQMTLLSYTSQALRAANLL